MSEISFDKALTLQSNGGVENERGGFDFRTADAAQKALGELGIVVPIPDACRERPATVRQHHNGKVIMDVEARESEPARGWRSLGRRSKKWTRIFDERLVKAEDLPCYDDTIRCRIVPGAYHSFVAKIRGEWVTQPPSQVRRMLQARKHTPTEADCLSGAMSQSPWTLESVPLAPREDPERRAMNCGAQFKFQLAKLVDGEVPYHPHWDKIYDHIGTELTPALKDLAWAQRAGIRTGADYLRAWVASVFQFPCEPTPFLFLYGTENCGKSIFHESIKLLLTSGVVNGYRALAAKNDFNGELVGALIAFIDEKSLADKPDAFARLREYVTAKTLPIRAMFHDAIDVPNYTHWIHTANKRSFLPVWPGDTRITVIHVPDLLEEQRIPKLPMEEELRKEAPHFLYTLMHLELPPVIDRLRVPMVVTASKTDAQEDGASEHARAVADWFAGDVTLTAKELVEAVHIAWPRSPLVIRTLIDDATPYLRSRGIAVEVIQRDHTNNYSFRKVVP